MGWGLERERERGTDIEIEGQDKEGLTNTMSTNTPLYHTFAFISGKYDPWDNFFIYHCDDVTMYYNAITVESKLGTFASKRLHKSDVKKEMVL